jgi:hypothetical protein
MLQTRGIDRETRLTVRFHRRRENMVNAPRHKMQAQRRFSSLGPWIGYNARRQGRPRKSEFADA